MYKAELAELVPPGSIIPVVVIETAEAAVPLAQALYAAGLSAVEITLRTPVAAEAAAAIAREVPELVLGVGTCLDAADVETARAAGARFLVSPGFTESLAAAARDAGLPLLPGATTVTEVMHARDAGFDLLKFFPASQAGGVKTLGYFASLFGDMSFCPTGGVDQTNVADYLALPNVTYVGGSYLAPAATVNAGDFVLIEVLARESAVLQRRDG